jgi:selenophosphate synthase
LLCLDPQTSGGLLLAVAPESALAFLAGLEAAGTPGWAIGRVEARDARGMLVVID